MGNLAVKPTIPNPGADRFYDSFAYSFQALNSESEDYIDILRVLSTQLQYVPPEEETFHLSINGRHIGHALLALANALMGDEHVAQLSIESAGIDHVSLDILLPVLSVNTTLKELYLTGNNFGALGVKNLTRSLLKNRTLVTLHVGGTDCGDEGAAWMADLLTCGTTGLRRIDMSGNGISEVGYAVLLDALKQNEKIVEIQLRDNNAPDEVKAPLVEICKERFKPFMEELRKEEELRAMLRKSGVGTPNPKKKGGMSIKQRLKQAKATRVSGSDGPVARGKREDLMEVDGGEKKAKSAPGSPREKKHRVQNLIAGSKPRGQSIGGPLLESDPAPVTKVEYDPAHVLRVHIIEAARLKPVQKNGVSDPYCRSSLRTITGQEVKTKIVRKTLSPQWKESFEVAFPDLSDWVFDLEVQDGKIGEEKGFLGRVKVSSKDWDLSEEKGQEQWLDIVDGLGAVRVEIVGSAEALPELKKISTQRKEAAAREKSIRDQATEQRAGRPRGRTMLAAPKPVAVAVQKKIQANIPTSASEKVCVGTAETMGRRPSMEDAILIQGKLGGNADRDLFAVFDGHGSERVAIYCAERLGEVLLKHLDGGVAPLEALRQSFYDLNKEVESFAINMGCTVVAALLEGNQIHVANCGDTRAVLCSAAGVAERLTVDHKPSLPDEIKRIEELGGFVKNGRVSGQLAVSRALGDANFAPFISCEPYLRSTEIGEDHTHLVLACDGLWDVFPDSLAGQIVCNQPNPSGAASMLRDRAFASGSTDNISVVTVQFKTPVEGEDDKEPEVENKGRKEPDPADGDPFAAFDK